MFEGLVLLYVILIIVGIALLLASLVFGELFDVIGFDASGDVDGSGWLSSTTLAVAIAGLGLAGYAGLKSGLPAWASVLVGLAVGGLLVVVVVVFIKRPLARQQADVVVGRSTYLGTQATVTMTVPAENGYGMVRFINRSGAVTEQRAYTADHQPHAAGELVQITAVGADHVSVATPSSIESTH